MNGWLDREYTCPPFFSSGREANFQGWMAAVGRRLPLAAHTSGEKTTMQGLYLNLSAKL